MKKSYKLLSIYLDRQPIPKERPSVIPVNNLEELYDVEEIMATKWQQ